MCFAEDIETQPVFVKNLIEDYKKVPVDVSPLAIYKYRYKGKEVFHVPALYCCDIPGTLYDMDGKILCHPDGGIAGVGDGKCIDFRTTREDGQVIWQDARVVKKPNPALKQDAPSARPLAPR